MARPVSIRDETILEAAREVFLEHGVQATTANVAARAGISEGTIFNRFQTKEALFQAAMLCPGASMPWIKNLDERIGTGHVRDHMVELGGLLVELLESLMPQLLMAWSSKRVALSRVGPKAMAEEASPAIVMRKIAGYFAAEARAGRIRVDRPDVLAKTYLGGLQSFVLLRLLHENSSPSASADEFVREHVKLLWKSIAPERQQRGKSVRSRATSVATHRGRAT